MGLSVAHANGILHRDLKPENILIDRYQRWRITDFGIANVTGEDVAGTTGTPAFAAPEQLLGEPQGPAADYFALAAIVYFTLTGEAPFGEGDAKAILAAQLPERADLGAISDRARQLVPRGFRSRSRRAVRRRVGNAAGLESRQQTRSWRGSAGGGGASFRSWTEILTTIEQLTSFGVPMRCGKRAHFPAASPQFRSKAAHFHAMALAGVALASRFAPRRVRLSQHANRRSVTNVLSRCFMGRASLAPPERFARFRPL